MSELRGWIADGLPQETPDDVVAAVSAAIAAFLATAASVSPLAAPPGAWTQASRREGLGGPAIASCMDLRCR